jgi:tetratricopeptide (TPR) repeat protein
VADDRKKRLLELYEARGDPDTFAEAKRLYEQALTSAEASDPETLIGYGYLLECHGRYALRQAVAQYERAIKLDPDADKPHYQHIWAQAALRETEPAIARYSQRLARSPTDVREHRFLANAYLAARDHQEAARVVDAGLALAPDDPMLLDVRGDALAATGDPEGALADWRRAVEVDPENLSPVYSSALLLERLGRLEEAAGGVAVHHRLVRRTPGSADGRVATAGAGAAAGQEPRRLSIRHGRWLAWPVPAPRPGTAHRAWQPGKGQIAAVGGTDRRSTRRRGRAIASIARSAAAPLPRGGPCTRRRPNRHQGVALKDRRC